MWTKFNELRSTTYPPKVEAVGKVLALLMGAVLVSEVGFVACLAFIPSFAQHFPWTHWNQ